MTAAGSIIGLFSGGFTIYGGTNFGNMHIYTGSSTVYSGGSPKVGSYAQATGTGMLGSSITASYVALYASAPPTVTLSGVAGSSTAYGFVEKAGSSSADIVLNNGVIVGGGKLATGASVKVTGTGTMSSILAQSIVVTTPTPAPTPTPGPIAQKHLLTADYLGAPYGTTSIAWSEAAPYLTWAQTTVANATAVSGAGIKTQFYADPNRTTPGTGDPLYNTDETTFAHDCNGNRVIDTYNETVTQYVMDIGGSSMQALFANYVARIASQAHFDAIYEDDAGPLSEDVYTPFSAMPCGYSDAAWISAGEAVNQVSSLPVIFNGLGALNGQNVSLSMGLLGSTNTIGGNFEHCYSDGGQPKMMGWDWQTIENSEIQTVARNKIFECQLRDSNAAVSSTDARLYALASFLLTYNPNSSILWEEYATPSGLHVEPESSLVVLNPIQAAPSSIAGLLQSGGTYGRQYGQCYLAGKFVGPCAVVVNADSQAGHTFPFPQYEHSLVLSGGGVLDGGTVSTSGPAPPLTLAAGEAVVAFP